MSQRTNALADRLEQAARSLASFASRLTDAEWQARVPKDGRKVGVVVHHVATMYPLEIQLAQKLAAGNPIEAVTWDLVHDRPDTDPVKVRVVRGHEDLARLAAEGGDPAE